MRLRDVREIGAMGLDFDVKNFCQNLRATKPPYECPVENCGKIYKSFCGIQFHLYNFDHENPANNASTNNTPSPGISAFNKSGGKKRGRWHHRQARRSPTPPEFIKVAREGLTYAEAQRLVEIDLDGRLHRINICDPLDIMYLEDSETESKNPEKTEERPTPKATKHCEGSKQRTREGAANPPKLPEASYRIITDYCAPDASPRPASYYRFIEKSAEELDEEVEYDMDEEDCAWLELMNDKRKSENISLVSPDTFELLMDRLEKESYFQSQSSGKDPNPSIDEDAVCCICNDGECQNSNVILFCDMCNLAVHQECYGVPYIPEGQWLCRRCLQSPSRAVDCVLCPNRGGAFKQTDDSRWAHVVCALWVPEVCFANTVFLEPIDSIENIPPARWKLTCYICKQRSVGACIQCHRANCYTAFHVTCAQQAGLFMKMEAFRESTSGGTSYNVRKTAYCDVHTPIGSDATDDDRNDSAKKAKAKAQSREKMRKARKILAEKRSAIPSVSIPTIPPDRLTKISSLVSMAKKHQFLQRLLGYWTLKRQSRNGVPLLRRLQANHQTRREQKDGENRSSALREELKYWQRLRQDLERARLLVELIRKREKLKREYVKVHQLVLQMKLFPFRMVLLQVLDQLQEKDAGNIFADPVELSEVPDYLDYIKQPMDFSTMRKKIHGHWYTNFDDFEADFNLIILNCMTYNAKETLFYRAAVRMRDQGGLIMRQAKRHVESIGYDPAIGTHLKEKPIDKSTECNFNEDDREGMPLEKQLKYLLDMLEQSASIKHGASRVKRGKYLRMEIVKVRRKLSILASGKVKTSKPSSDSEEQTKRAESMLTPVLKRKKKFFKSKQKTVVASPVDPQYSDEESEELPHLSSDSSAPSSPLPSLQPESRVGRPKKRTTLLPPLLSTTSTPVAKVRKTRSLSTSSQKLPKTSLPPVLKPQVPIPQQRKDQQEHLPPRACRLSKPNLNDSFDSEDEEKDDTKDKEIDETLDEETLRPKMTRSRKRLRSEAEFTPVKRAESSDKSDRSHSTSTARSGAGSNRHRLLAAGPSLDTDSDSGTDMTSESTPGTGINRRTALFKKRSDAKKATAKRTSSRTRKSTDCGGESAIADPEPNMFALTLDSLPKEKVTRRHGRSVTLSEPMSPKHKAALPTTSATPVDPLPAFPTSPLPQTDSFKIYRSNNLQEASESDNNSKSSSSDDSSSSSENETGSDSEDSDSQEGRGDRESHQEISGWSSEDHLRIPLEPLDLVWAKCRGYPWYPALIINPEMPKSGFSQNGVPIPVPPDEVLQLQKNTSGLVYLVLFFDVKRTWQWLPRNKLEPLGVDSAMDKAKLVESKKPQERKAVKKAYENAILHRCRVTGESTGISGESSNED